VFSSAEPVVFGVFAVAAVAALVGLASGAIAI